MTKREMYPPKEVVRIALDALRRHAWMRYRNYRKPEDRYLAIRGQAFGLVRHDRILTGRWGDA